MIGRRGGAFALVLAAMPVAAAWAAPTAQELAAVSEAEQRGAEMFAYDQAAWHATDRFQEDIGRRGTSIDALQAQGLGGYIVEPDAGGVLLTTFYGQRDGRRFAIARYTVNGSTVMAGGFVEADGDRGLSLLAGRMIDAREKAMAARREPNHGLCSQSPANSLVLPPRPDGTLSVYILTSTVTADVYPAGGHYRFDFDAGGKLVGERRFMNSCFDIDSRMKDGKRPAGVFVTHLLDPQPTEIHAFVSRNIPVKLSVATVGNNAIWDVSQGHIAYVRDIPRKN
ncbi:MAG: hypothetical protein LBV50_12100 [Novosphingobium sp.]|jgi:hypothetical protein|nr:hypothetical protein [Novosphingobium sp.]